MRFRNGKINTALLLTIALFVYMVIDIVVRTLTVCFCSINLLNMEPFFQIGALIVNPVTIPLALVVGLTQLILGLLRKREDGLGK